MTGTRPVSDALPVGDKTDFLRKLFVEISRARRLQLPVSLLVMRVDEIQKIQSLCGAEGTQALMGALSRYVLQDMRVYDILGSWPLGYMGLILPHTSMRAGGDRAEQIRSVTGSTDFSKVLSGCGSVSLSTGLSEYPKVGRSASSLFESTLKALSFAAHQGGGNMTAVVTPAKGFRPDFTVPRGGFGPLRDMV